ncbi:hypothetical protein SCARD494_13832 [Seiridium cardinale]
MRIPPASILATWPIPNYDRPVTRGPGGKIVGVALTTFTTLVLAIRVYTRLRIVRSFGLDDILIITAFIPSLAFTVCGIYAEVSLGWDRHLWDVPYSLLQSSAQLSLLTFCLFDLSSNLVKLSSLAMLYRLVGVSKSRMSPISEYWTLSSKPQNCINEATHLLAAGLINTVTDFIVVTLPIKTVARLHLRRKQYIMLIGLFCAGFCACAAGCVRTYYTWGFTVDYDRTWNGWAVWVSSAIELYLGIICASVPSCKQFFTTYLPGVIDSTRRSGRSADSQVHNRKFTTISVTVDTRVETSYQNRSDMNPLLSPPVTAPGEHELSGLNKPVVELPEPSRPRRPDRVLRCCHS